MPAKKSFDCVEMKNQIQARIMADDEGLSDAEIRSRRQRMLETSDSLVARKWREIRERQDQKQHDRKIAK